MDIRKIVVAVILGAAVVGAVFYFAADVSSRPAAPAVEVENYGKDG